MNDVINWHQKRRKGVICQLIIGLHKTKVEAALRERLKTTYPTAEVHTLHNVGHFPYVNEPETYTELLKSFFSR
jgi:pimeloyl-ACP methyl ester carboxylesterase